MNYNIQELQANKQDLRSLVIVIEEIGTATKKYRNQPKSLTIKRCINSDRYLTPAELNLSKI
ncbi:hypothetical protein SAMN05421868_1085 [Paenibacillus naphthalenovorans]|nr:hypothetical protein SAMN05421868_1085 [Paenibacillus naphthalenovorans]